jgi:hypothetical protein
MHSFWRCFEHCSGPSSNLSLYVSSFSCRPFSRFHNKNTLLDEPEAKVFYGVARRILIVRPPVFLLENVQGIKRVLPEILETLGCGGLYRGPSFEQFVGWLILGHWLAKGSAWSICQSGSRSSCFIFGVELAKGCFLVHGPHINVLYNTLLVGTNQGRSAREKRLSLHLA